LGISFSFLLGFLFAQGAMSFLFSSFLLIFFSSQQRLHSDPFLFLFFFGFFPVWSLFFFPFFRQ